MQDDAPAPERAAARRAARQRQHVVHVDHVRGELAGRRGHVVLVAPAAQQRERGSGRETSAELRSSSACAIPARRKAATLQLDGALLAALDAVAVVDDEDAHAAGLRYPADGPAGPAVTVVVPTRGRAAYLEVTLESLRAQRSRRPARAARGGRRVDRRLPRGGGAPRRALREPRRAAQPQRRARNPGMREAGAPLIAFVDDDVLVPAGWLDALVEGAERHPEAEAFGGPIRASLEGRARAAAAARTRRSPRSTWGRRTARRRWCGARTSRSAARRSSASAVRRVDHASARRRGGVAAAPARRGRRIVYLADAGLDHRRSAADSRLRPLARAAYSAGAAPAPTRPRAEERRRGSARAARAGRLRLAHRAARLPAGLIMGAHAAGRVMETCARDELDALRLPLRRRRRRDGPRRRAKRRVGEVAFGDRPLLRARAARCDSPGRGAPRARRAGARRVPAGLAPPGGAAALRSERHRVRLRARLDGAGVTGRCAHTRRRGARRRQVREPQPGAGGGRPAPRTGRSWSTTTCVSPRLPRPLHRRVRGVRARPRPAGADAAQPLGLEGHAPAARLAGARDALRGDRAGHRLRREPAAELLPFPELRYGWGLDLHWAALAAERGWRLGVVDALPVRHERGTVAAAYPREEAEDEAARFLERAPLPAERACRRGARRAPEVADMRLLFVCPDMRTGGAERHWATLIPLLRPRRGRASWSAWRARAPFFGELVGARRARRVASACGGRSDARGCGGRSPRAASSPTWWSRRGVSGSSWARRSRSRGRPGAARDERAHAAHARGRLVPRRPAPARAHAAGGARASTRWWP